MSRYASTAAPSAVADAPEAALAAEAFFLVTAAFDGARS